ncbi:type II toxin-antitoxin system RelE/ParE family toxin [Candidatus Pacearchaeota archaeon]|nr:type II toxin-antitoxin system RelE/ParE family toxin [Candidatus Pacearchaeota archaeon]
MVTVIIDEQFKRLFTKIKDPLTKERIIKQIEKIKSDPEIGKPMRNVRKGTRELYIAPHRLSYEYNKEQNIVYILDFYHKDEQ